MSSTLAEQFVIFALPVAVLDWVAVARRWRCVEYVCKPAVLVLLIVAALFAGDEAHSHHQWVWFVPALVLSLLGDVFLMLPRDRFVPGLASFLLAHVCYIVAFTPTAPPLGPSLGVVAAVAVASAVVFSRVRRGLNEKDERALVGPLTLYMVAVSLTAVAAIVTLWRPGFPGSSSQLAAGGATLFYASDGMIGWDRFVRTTRWLPVAIIVTYHLGQAALVLSLLG